MPKRGRPLARPTPELPNRILFWRTRRNLTQGELGAKVGLSYNQIRKIERIGTSLTALQLGRIADALDVAPENLLNSGPEISIPVRYTVRMFEAEGGPCEFAKPYDRIAAPKRLPDPEACFAAVVDDDSADRLYPIGSTLICRPLAKPAEIRNGAKVIVRRFLDRTDQDTFEVLVGIVQRGALGDIQLSLRTNNRQHPIAVPIRRAGAAEGFSERYATTTASNAPINYQPMFGDDAEILGLVVMAFTFE